MKTTAACIDLEFDGIKLKAWAETNGDIHLQVEDYEEAIMSKTTASILGMALIAMAEEETE